MNRNNSVISPWVVAQGIVAFLAGLSAALAALTAVRYRVPSSLEAWYWQVQLVLGAGALYGSTMTAVHGRWGAILNRCGRVSLGVALSVAAGHLVVWLSVLLAALRQWESRALLARLDGNFAAWFTISGLGAIVSLLSIQRKNSEEPDDDLPPPTLNGWTHALPPLLVGLALAAALYWLESLPLPT